MDIITEIDRFINDRTYHYALMINGKWGSGKTFFVKDTLINHIKETSSLDVNYISLYGISSTSEISEMLCMQAIRDKTPESISKALDKKGGQIFSKTASIALKVIMNRIGTPDKAADDILALFPNYDNNVIIFDDLERCGCDINEVLGYINDFVEHTDASVIIVANEDEIGKWQLDRNPELQTLIALDPHVEIDLPDRLEDLIRSIGNRTGAEKSVRTTFNVDEVELRRQALFHSNEKYKRMKEKVIGITINFEPDLEKIFCALIKKTVQDKVLLNTLQDSIDWFVETATRDDHKNLRTFQFFLEKTSRIFEVIDNKYPEIQKQIVKYTFRRSIQYMKGKPAPTWDADYGSQAFSDNALYDADQEFGFRFIDDLITKNEVDSDHVNEVLQRYCRILSEKGQLQDDPYSRIADWWQTEDDKVEEWLDEIEKNVSGGKYSTELYTGLLKYLAELKTYNIMAVKCDSIYAAMKNYISNAESKCLRKLDNERFVISNKDVSDTYISMRREIEELINNGMRTTESQKYMDAINDSERWASNLLRISEGILLDGGRSFMFCLDADVLANCISDSSNYELSVFRQLLQSVYNGRIYWESTKDDYDKMVALRDKIKSMDFSKLKDIKRCSIDWIIEDMETIIEKLPKNVGAGDNNE